MQLRSGISYKTDDVKVKQEENEDNPQESMVEIAKKKVRARVKARQEEKVKQFKQWMKKCHNKKMQHFLEITQSLMDEFENPKNETAEDKKFDRGMHQIGILKKLFDILNDPQYEKVLMDPKCLRFRKLALEKCDIFEGAAYCVLIKRIETARSKLVGRTRSETKELRDTETYYSTTWESLKREIANFYSKYSD